MLMLDWDKHINVLVFVLAFYLFYKLCETIVENVSIALFRVTTE